MPGGAVGGIAVARRTMRFEIEINGTTHDVTVDVAPDTPGRFYVSWGGTRREVDARVVERHDYGMLLSLIRTDDDALSRQVRCSTVDPSGAMTVRAGGIDHSVVVNGSRRRVNTRESGASGGGLCRLKAPMPGKVVRILVAPGDAVEAQQPLVVVEAMKMENELTAARAGTVTDVVVAEGASVESGRLLVVIE